MEDLSNEELAEPEVLNMEEAAAVRVDVSAFFDLCSAARAQFLAISSWNFLSSRCGLGLGRGIQMRKG